jgi:hypothetical protein
MSWWPGWDSIEWTDFWNTFYFWAGIFCLFLLGASEVVSHYYGERHSALVAAAASRKAEEQKQQDTRRDRELVEAHNAARSANDELEKLREQRSPRHLTDAQKNEIIEAISPFKGQAVTITSNAGDIESDDFAKEFYDIILKAQWGYRGTPGKFEVYYVGAPIGVEVTINDVSARKGRVPEADAYNALIAVLHKLGIVGENEPTFINSGTPAGTIQIRVGTKPLIPGQTSADRNPEGIVRSLSK